MGRSSKPLTMRSRMYLASQRQTSPRLGPYWTHSYAVRLYYEPEATIGRWRTAKSSMLSVMRSRNAARKTSHYRKRSRSAGKTWRTWKNQSKAHQLIEETLRQMMMR